MMIEQNTLVAKTRDFINQYVGSNTDTFTTETNTILKSFIDAAAKMVAQVAPGYCMVLKIQTLTTTWDDRCDGNAFGTASLPSDYMRLEKIDVREQDGETTKMLMKQPITALLAISDPSYCKQYASVPGLGAGLYKPVAYRIDGKVEIHSLPAGKKNSAVVTIYYYKTPKVETENSKVGYASLTDELLEPIAMQAASLYLGVTGDAAAQYAQSAAKEMMQALIIGKLPSAELSTAENKQ